MAGEIAVDPKSLVRLKSLAWMHPEQAQQLAQASEPLRVRREGVIARDGRRLIIVPEKLWQVAQTPQHPSEE